MKVAQPEHYTVVLWEFCEDLYVLLIIDHGDEPAAAPSGGGSVDDNIADQQENEHDLSADESLVDMLARRHIEELRHDMGSIREAHGQAFAEILEKLAELNEDTSQPKRHTAAPIQSAAAPW